MPSLKEIAAKYYLDMLVLRPPRDGEVTELSEIDADKATIEDIHRLAALSRHQAELIRRLKHADESRAELHEKLRERWRTKQDEAAKLRNKLRTFRKLLAQRRWIIRDLNKRLRLSENSLKTLYENPGLMPPLDAATAGPGNFASVMSQSLVKRFPFLTKWIWRSWMRLGVLKQYEARPVIPDRIPQARVTEKDMAVISIVTPSYNQAAYLEQTMQSVLEQNYPHLEYLVMDGGSNDDSVDIIKRHESALAHWQSAKDGGQADAVRTGLARSSGEIMAWLNSDDLIMPGTLKYVADYFARHPEVDLVYGHRLVINQQGHEVARWVLPRHDHELLLWADFIPQETCFWRRRIYEKVGGIDASFQFALDWDLLLRFQKAGARIVRLPYFMGAFRIHNEQKNAVTISIDGYREMQLLRQRELGNEFSRGGLARRVNKAQLEARLLTALLRFGIRY